MLLDIGNNVAQYLDVNSSIFAVFKGAIIAVVLLHLRRISSLTIAIGILLVFMLRELNIVVTGQELYLFPDLVYFLRIFFFLCWLLLFAEKREHTSLLLVCSGVFIVTVYLSVLCQFSGAVFHLAFFKAYGDQRLGYKGLYQAENDTSVFYLLALVYALSAWRKGDRVFFFIVASGLILLGIGSKTALLGLIGVPVIYLISSNRLKSPFVLRRISVRPRPLIGWSLFVMCSAFIIYAFSRYFETLLVAIDYEQMLRIYKSSGLLSSMLSFRDLKVEAYLTSLRSIPSALFGLQIPKGLEVYGMDTPGSFMYEIDLFDYLARIGLIGTLITAFAITRSTGVVRWKSLTTEFKTLFVTVLLCGATVGHTLISSINAVWISLAMIAFSVDRRNAQGCSPLYKERP